VLVPSGHARLPAGGMLEAAVDLPAGTQDLVIGIYNGNNELVRNVHLGRQTAGVVSFAWDGADETGALAPAGVYELRAVAGGQGESRALDTLAKSRVNSVSLGGQGGGISLNLDGLGEVDFAQVREIM
jgi:flagellar basal-body rod modification protein FlgD